MNNDFVQIYPKGWARMRALLRRRKSQAPLLLYTFIAENIDPDGGVLVADQETICEAIGVSRTTLWRAISFLEERNALLGSSLVAPSAPMLWTRPRSGSRGIARRSGLYSRLGLWSGSRSSPTRSSAACR